MADLLAWDSGAARRPYRWRSRLYLNKIEASYQIAQVRAADYTSLTMRIYAEGVLIFERAILSKDQFTLPPIPQVETEIEFEGTSRVYSVEIAEDVEELE